jgi:hypothetical protein
VEEKAVVTLKDYGKSENDLGVWFPFGEELPAPFDVRVRRIPYDVAQRINKRYGREQMIVVDGVRRPHIERTAEETTKWLLDQAAWAWVDAKRLEIEIGDDDAARLWTGLLKREVLPAETLILEGGTLTHEVKLRILTQIRPFARVTDGETLKKERQDLGTFLILKAALLQSDAAKAEEESRGNS